MSKLKNNEFKTTKIKFLRSRISPVSPIDSQTALAETKGVNRFPKSVKTFYPSYYPVHLPPSSLSLSLAPLIQLPRSESTSPFGRGSILPCLLRFGSLTKPYQWLLFWEVIKKFYPPSTTHQDHQGSLNRHRTERNTSTNHHRKEGVWLCIAMLLISKHGGCREAGTIIDCFHEQLISVRLMEVKPQTRGDTRLSGC